MLTKLSLFSGIGGDDLASEWAGVRTVCFVEKDKFCQKVLKKHWPGVPIIEDVKDVTRAKIMAYAQGKRSRWGGNGRTRGQIADRFEQGSKTTYDISRNIRKSPVDIVAGGFPCQPFSVAGKRRGKEDDRYLWPEMLRIVRELKSTWVVGENVAGIINLGLDTVLSDLEGSGYEVQTFVIPACGVNAPHRRYRVFIVAHASHRNGHSGTERVGRQTGADIGGCGERTDVAHPEQSGLRNKPTEGQRGDGRESSCPETQSCSQDVAHSDTKRLEGFGRLRECGGQWLTWQGSEPLEGIWKSEPPVGRVASRISARVDRLRALGNAVVPQQITPIYQAIVEVERERNCR